MKRILALVLALSLTLMAAAAFAAPANVKDIEGLPELPEVPTMKTKLVGDTQYVTMSGPVGWLSAVRNWSDYTALEFDENHTASFSTKGQTGQVGFAQWGWHSDTRWSWAEEFAGDAIGDEVEYTPVEFNGSTYGTGGSHAWNYEKPVNVAVGYVIASPVLDDYTDEDGVRHVYIYNETVDYPAEEYDEETYDYLCEEYIDERLAAIADTDDEMILEAVADYVMDNYGYVYFDDDGRVDIIHSGYYVDGGVYDMGYAYHGGDNNGVEYKYARNGALVAVSKEVTGANFLGSEKTPVKSIVTWSTGKNTEGAGVIYISSIVEEFEDGAKSGADFAQNGKCIKVY